MNTSPDRSARSGHENYGRERPNAIWPDDRTFHHDAIQLPGHIHEAVMPALSAAGTRVLAQSPAYRHALVNGAAAVPWLTDRMRLISVDFQHDFVSPGGVHYRGQPCVGFVTGTVVPFVRARGIAVAEIVSDYRSPGGDDADATCVSGQWGYESAIPADLKPAAPWVKASVAPTWVRDGGGRADAIPGPARPDPTGFATWLDAAIGPPDRKRTGRDHGTCAGGVRAGDPDRDRTARRPRPWC